MIVLLRRPASLWTRMGDSAFLPRAGCWDAILRRQAIGEGCGVFVTRNPQCVEHDTGITLLIIGHHAQVQFY